MAHRRTRGVSGCAAGHVGFGGESSDPLRYQDEAKAPAGKGGELAYLKIRYKLPGKPDSQLIERPPATAAGRDCNSVTQRRCPLADRPSS